MGQAVVEVHVDAAGGLSVRLHLDAVRLALIGEEIARRAAVRPAGCDGDKLADVDRVLRGDVYAGGAVQRADDLDGLVAVQIDIAHCIVFVLITGNVHLAGNGEDAVLADIHTTAVIPARGIQIVGNAAAVHIEGAFCINIHAAAPRTGGSIAGDLTAVHIKYGAFFPVVKTYAAAPLGAVSGDAAAVHIEESYDIYAAAIHALGVGDLAAALAAALAVAEGECIAFTDIDGIANAIHRDVAAVQAEHHAVDGVPSAPDRHRLLQEVVSCLGDLIQTGNAHPALPIGESVGVVRAGAVAADGVIGMLRPRRQCDLFGRPLQNGDHLLRTGEGGLLFLRQGVVGLIGLGRGKAGALPRLAVHAVQFRRVRQSVDHRLHLGHGLLCGRVLLLFFLFRRLALLLRFHRLILLLRFRRLAFLLHFPVCRVCRFLHGRGRLRRPLCPLRQRRRGQQRQAQSQRHETAQDTLLHRFPPSVSSPPGSGLHGQRVSRRGLPYGPGGAPGHLLQVHGSSVAYFPRLAGPSARNVLFST